MKCYCLEIRRHRMVAAPDGTGWWAASCRSRCSSKDRDDPRWVDAGCLGCSPIPFNYFRVSRLPTSSASFWPTWVTLGAQGNSRSCLGCILHPQVGLLSRPRSLTQMGHAPMWGLQANVLDSAFSLDASNPDWQLITDTLRIVLRTPETQTRNPGSVC